MASSDGVARQTDNLHVRLQHLEDKVAQQEKSLMERLRHLESGMLWQCKEFRTADAAAIKPDDGTAAEPMNTRRETVHSLPNELGSRDPPPTSPPVDTNPQDPQNGGAAVATGEVQEKSRSLRTRRGVTG
jgi:hypothetical protein